VSHEGWLWQRGPRFASPHGCFLETIHLWALHPRCWTFPLPMLPGSALPPTQARLRDAVFSGEVFVLKEARAFVEVALSLPYWN